MATLTAIGFTAAGGGVITAFSFAFFAVAVRSRSCNVAPRCTARSKNTIFNPNGRRGKRSFFLLGNKRDSKKDDGDGDNESNSPADESLNYDEATMEETKEEVQYRGGPMFGWIPWTLSLSYDQLLQGVPGTGTRKDGMAGINLRVNMDGIILLRFHALCLRVSFLATIIAIGIILPLNLTAQCFKTDESDESGSALLCNPTNYSLTDYEQTTLANIPSLEYPSDSGEAKSWLYSLIGYSIPVIGERYNTFLGRLYAVVVFSWILVGYTLKLMRKEWVETLALRRVYYLEGTHWENRVAELNQTGFNAQYGDDSDSDEEMGIAKRRKANNPNKARKLKQKKKKKKVPRDPWIPHPEQRETVPNIELYSVLVGNIPSLPSEIAENNFQEMGFTKKQSLSWQLAVTATFFDQCVPNQPGFTSSVAAVTILPDAPKLAKAWRTWYKHVGLLRRLRFVKKLIAEKRHYDIEFDDDSSSSSVYDLNGIATNEKGNSSDPLSDKRSLDFLFPLNSPAKDPGVEEKVQEEEIRSKSHEDHLDVSVEASESGSYDSDPAMEQLQRRIAYFYQDVFGALDQDGGLEMDHTLISHALAYGPEQAAVYSREFAQGAAACCPNGCREERVLAYDLVQLEDLKEEISIAVKESFKELREAQDNNVQSDRSLSDSIKDQVQAHNSNLPAVTSVEDIRLPEHFDVETELFHKGPKNFQGKDMINNVQEGESIMETDRRLSYKTQVRSNFGGPRLTTSNDADSKGNNVPLSDSESLASKICLSNQGRVYFKDTEEGLLGDVSAIPASANHGGIQSSMRARTRNNTGFSQLSLPSDSIAAWDKVQQIVQDDAVTKGEPSVRRKTFTGEWKIPSVKDQFRKLYRRIASLRQRTVKKVEDFSSESTFAVVTFTSRQAAIAARHCLADGRGVSRWTPVEDIPVPPLADAASFDFKTCRGCCRPVTLTVNPQQQFLRKYTALFILIVMYVFYTVPLTFISTLVAPEKLEKIIPGLAELAAESQFLNKLLQGIVPALLNSLFFALCPVIFKAISNFGSNSISVNQAEYIALQYYWYFMVFTAFSGTSLANMALAYFNEKRTDGNNFTSVLVEIARSLPSQVSALWLNWIILRTLVILPLQYMLQVNTFIFQWLGWKCCRRCVMGGGPGGPIPYRIYIDSGVVFMTIVALAPVSPLIAPFALLYFLYCAPLWRRNVIYLYRPRFDTGGLRWPFLSDVLISSLCVAQVLLTTVMSLKEAFGPAVLAALPLLPIIMHRRSHRKRFLRAYNDAALLQTSSLDGWDNNMITSPEVRDEYRKFLVDAHKAAYVPICIAGGSTLALTAEPALVIPHNDDLLMPTPLQNMPSTDLDSRMGNIQPIYSMDRSPTITSPLGAITERAKFQPHASMRRMRTFSQNDQFAGFSADTQQHRNM